MDWEKILLVLLGAALGIVASPITELLKRWFLGPHLRLEFRDSEYCVAKTPMANDAGQVVGEAYYFRVRVTNNSYRVAKNCGGFLTRVARKRGQVFEQIYYDCLPLIWSFRRDDSRAQRADLLPHVASYLDVVATFSHIPGMHPQIVPVPERYKGLFLGGRSRADMARCLPSDYAS